MAITALTRPSCRGRRPFRIVPVLSHLRADWFIHNRIICVLINWSTFLRRSNYRVSQQVSDLGWVNFYLEVPLIFTSCSAHSAHVSSAQAELGRQRNIQNPSQPNPGPRPAGTPFIVTVQSACNGSEVGQVKCWANKRIEPLQDDPLSDFDCTKLYRNSVFFSARFRVWWLWIQARSLLPCCGYAGILPAPSTRRQMTKIAPGRGCAPKWKFPFWLQFCITVKKVQLKQFIE